MSEQRRPGEGGERNVARLETTALNESKRAFLESKLAQYTERFRIADRDIRYRAPELTGFYIPYYDALAKMTATKHLLETGRVSREGILSLVTGSVVERFEEPFDSHQGIIDDAIRNAWEVVSAYNEGREGEL